MALITVSCQDCGADSDNTEIYVQWKNSRKRFFCFDCLFRDELASIPKGTAAYHYISEHEDDFSEWIEDNTDTYEDLLEEEE